jgi:hypothetical protein
MDRLPSFFASSRGPAMDWSQHCALSTGLFVWRIARMRQKEHAAQAIGEVNHHIRNCLQILVCENFARPQLSDDSVYAIKRID